MVPALSDVMALSSLDKKLKRDDFPEFGGPKIKTFVPYRISLFLLDNSIVSEAFLIILFKEFLTILVSKLSFSSAKSMDASNIAILSNREFLQILQIFSDSPKVCLDATNL